MQNKTPSRKEQGTVNEETDIPTYLDIDMSKMPAMDTRTVGKELRDKLPRVTKSPTPEGDAA